MSHHLHYKDNWKIFINFHCAEVGSLTKAYMTSTAMCANEISLSHRWHKAARKSAPLLVDIFVSFRDKQPTDLMREEITKMTLKEIFFTENIQENILLEP